MNAALAIALLLAVPSAHKARPRPALMPLDLYDAGGIMIMSCQVDEIGNTTDCCLIGDKQKALDGVAQRLWDAAHVRPVAHFRKVSE